MVDDGTPPSERMAVAFEKLRASAKSNKLVSDELSRAVSAVETTLARLDLRVACYHRISGKPEDSYHDGTREYIGYIEHKGEWRVVINTDEGEDGQGESIDNKTWPFDKAPQYLRAKAIDKLPDLIEALVSTVDKTTERLKKKVPSAQGIATAVTTMGKKKVTP